MNMPISPWGILRQTLYQTDIAANPVSDLENSVAQSIDDDIIGNASLTYEFTDGLVGKASLGFDLDNLTQNYFAPHYTALGLANGGTGSIAKRRLETWQTEFTLNYRHNFGRSHQLSDHQPYFPDRLVK